MPAASLQRLARYPIKSIGGETLERVTLSPGQALPGDRQFGVLHRDAMQHLEGGELRKWLPKSAFVRGVAGPELQAVRGGWGADGILHLTHPALPPLIFDPQGDDTPLLRWIEPLWAPAGKAPPARFVTGPQPLSDKKNPVVSLLSLDSLADLEARLGRPLGVDRWRANLWISGWEPYAEHDMVTRELTIGPVRAKVVATIGRCAATSADTSTGELDGDMPADLQKLFGHDDFGVYIEIIEGGEIAPGDPVTLL